MKEIARPPATRLWGIVARKAARAVIFRRGPTKQVMLVVWHTDTHEFFAGQWLKARVYERRADLSPSGRKLIYFAADYRREPASWTAVSRPPFFKALALWPKGDAWGGGGLFATERLIQLNHPPYQRKLGAGWALPKTISVEPLHEHAGCGEDDPIDSMRMLRDGWTMTQPGKWERRGRRWNVGYENVQNEVWRRRIGTWTIERRVSGIYERHGAKYVLTHRVLDLRGEVALDFGRSDWCDWSYSREILLARDGRLYRTSISSQGKLGSPVELIDLRAWRFEAVIAPDAAAKWGGEPVIGRPIQ
jgi:hypothetical protein